MKRKDNEIAKKLEDVTSKEVISRKQAIKKTGYMALTAATAMILLSNPKKAQAASPAPPSAW